MGEVTLYQISDRYREAFEALSALQEQGEIEPMMVADTLNAIECEFNDKAANVGAYILGLKSFIEQVEAEQDRLSDIHQKMVNRFESLKAYLKHEMEAMGISKIESNAAPFVKIGIKKNPPKVVMDDPKAIPEEYVSEQMSFVYDKAGIKKALQSGADVPGAHLEAGTRLEVK